MSAILWLLRSRANISNKPIPTYFIPKWSMFIGLTRENANIEVQTRLTYFITQDIGSIRLSFGIPGRMHLKYRNLPKFAEWKKEIYTYENESGMHDKIFKILPTTSEQMAQFQYVWHNTWANVLLKFKTNKTFKYILKVNPKKPIILWKQNHIFWSIKKISNRILINSLYQKLVKIYKIKIVRSCLKLIVIPGTNVTFGKF